MLPLGYDDARLLPGEQSLDDDELVLALFGRLVPEKGVVDAVEILARVNGARPARLVVVGSGPEEAAARSSRGGPRASPTGSSSLSGSLPPSSRDTTAGPTSCSSRAARRRPGSSSSGA